MVKTSKFAGMARPTFRHACQNCGAMSGSLFGTLSPEFLDRLNKAKRCSVYRKGEVIFHEGVQPAGVYCINSGKVKVYRTGDEARETIVHLAKAGDLMGYRALVTEDVYSCSASAIDETSVCFIPREEFLAVVKENPNFATSLLQLLGKELREAEKSIANLARKPVRERVAEAILQLYETYGTDPEGAIDVILTREEIASIVGTATESAIRILSDLKAEGSVSFSGRKIVVSDLQKLRRSAKGF